MILYCLGKALRICFPKLTFVLPPIVGVNRLAKTAFSPVCVVCLPKSAPQECFEVPDLEPTLFQRFLMTVQSGVSRGGSP